MAESYCKSYYAATANKIDGFSRLEESIDVDVAIVGGGFTGISTAVELAERGVRVAVLEANRIAWGASSRNGGQITGSLSGDRAMEKQFRRKLGKDAADFVWKLRWRGHEIIRRRVEKYAIACDLKFGHMQAAYKPSHIAELEAMYQAALDHGMGDEVQFVRGPEVEGIIGTKIYHAGLVNRRNMHVHSLNLCLGEANAARSLGARIYEDSRVEKINYGKRPELVTAAGRVRADKVLLAGNAYHRLAPARLAGMLFPASLGIVTTEPLPEELARAINPQDLAVYDTRFVLDYYRLTADKRLLFGSGTNYTGKETRNIEDVMRPAIEKTFPQLKGVRIDFGWQGQDGISINRIPQLGKVAANVYYAQGYSGHGVATSHIIGEIMASALCGDSRDFDVFACARHWRMPVGRYLGNQALAIGMWYFQQLEKFR
ncbi:FAD-binding oxidoreductase [Sinorhizobium sp. BG8]|uniref:NAD(P)/FAD-dependent oxidoreductase n=1 Tax=Sinorhizobium sp. BG8 TaxID=2613773 RepID=UPI00193DD982|nr:FAD-binding oxidoreductase [Sinorhizobium sp. BG8]QRM57665.1 FAD-binding oxidoreductase [Sinorhizobium sp. BG8]